MRTGHASSVALERGRPIPPASARIGFLGNGQTATNHQAVQWYLSRVWPLLRQRHPTARLRLIGRLPGAISNSSGQFRCERRPARPSAPTTPSAPGPQSTAAERGPRCGWAWGTIYAGVEAANGIDELGYLPSDAMVREILTWRAMVAPIRATTGINTKLLVALELGVPLIATSAAAAPLGLAASGGSGGGEDGSAGVGGGESGSVGVGGDSSGLGGGGGSASAGASRTGARAGEGGVNVRATMPSVQQPTGLAEKATGVAAAPERNRGAASGMPEPSAALIADEPSVIVSASLRMLNSNAAWRGASRGALEALRRMEHSDPAAADMKALLRAVCSGPQQRQAGHVTADLLSPSTSAAQPGLNLSSCAVLDPQAVCAD